MRAPRPDTAAQDTDIVRALRDEVAEVALRLGLAGQRLLVAASGGVDSTVLAHACAQLELPALAGLALGHVHHGLRGDAADADQQAVEALAASLGVPCVWRRVDPQRLRDGRSSRDRPTLQEAARTARYGAFHEMAHEVGASRIATAHNADDQAETVLLRLLRGTGPDGLAGIPEQTPDGRVLRPLLSIPRERIVAYARACGLAWREDASNGSDAYARSRLRHRWLPGLADDFNPRLLRAIVDLAEAQRRDSEWIGERVAVEAERRFSVEGAWLRIDAKDFSALPESLSRRLAREALSRCGSARLVSRVHLARMTAFLAAARTGTRLQLPGDLVLLREREGFRLGPGAIAAHGRGGRPARAKLVRQRGNFAIPCVRGAPVAARRRAHLGVRVNQQFYRNMALWVVILVMILLLVTMLRQSQEPTPPLAYSEFVEKVEQGSVESVTIEENQISGVETNGNEFTTYAPVITEGLLAQLDEKVATVEARPKPESSFWRQILIMWFPLLLFIGLWIFFIRQMQSGGGKAMSFGKSRARLLTENQHRVTFDDVAGVEESKTELEEIIAFLREPKKFTRLGGRIPKGVLLIGPPGTGKTLLARAVAGEAGVPFYSISGSDFVEMFVGVGASRVRDLFLQGKKNAPCIIFIDEIDAVGRHRGAGLGGGHDEREQTLNQLLVEMDGFESNEGVILIAATNRPDVLDPALLRPGRFDRRVVVPRPDLRGRLAILKVHTKRVNLADDVELEVVARGTPGFVGADLQNLVNESALLAARRDAQQVFRVDFESAKDKVILGTERKSLIMSDDDKRETAYHEAGHALVALLSEHADPVHKVTIIPRGMALGVTMTMPEEDRYGLSREQILAQIRHAMGGRAAEELVFSRFTTGAANDLKQATEQARRMVCSYGMSERIGPMSFSDDDHDVFLGRDFVQRRDYSQKKAMEIDEEVSRLLNEAYDDAKQLLLENRATLDRISEALLERETLDTEELRLLVEGSPLPPLPPIAGTPASNDNNPPPEHAPAEPTGSFPGDKLPDPEPVPG